MRFEISKLESEITMIISKIKEIEKLWYLFINNHKNKVNMRNLYDVIQTGIGEIGRRTFEGKAISVSLLKLHP